MKKLFVLLLLANIALFGYAYFDRMNSAAQASSDRFKPLNADQVKVLTTQQVARLGPAKVAQLTLACAEWGPLSESDRTKASKLLEPLALGKTLLSRRVEVTAEHWVYIAPKTSRASADRALADLKKLNVTDSAIVLEPGQWNLAISLGVFRSKDDADAPTCVVEPVCSHSNACPEHACAHHKCASKLTEPATLFAAILFAVVIELPNAIAVGNPLIARRGDLTAPAAPTTAAA